MNEQERELDLMVAELEQENRLLRARNERLEREALSAPVPDGRIDFVEAACALIKAADDAAADGDYMLDSNDCIAVLRGTWKGPMLNDMPPKPSAQAAPTQDTEAHYQGVIDGVQKLFEDKRKAAPVQEPVKFEIGGRYNWKGQQERLIYMGYNFSGNGRWHQFAKVEDPEKVWCEVQPEDLSSFEATPPAAPDLQAELEATNRQVKILSDALAESRREIASIKQAITDPENQPSQFGTVTMAHMQREVAAEREESAYRAGVALLGQSKVLSDRVVNHIRARGQA